MRQLVRNTRDHCVAGLVVRPVREAVWCWELGSNQHSSAMKDKSEEAVVGAWHVSFRGGGFSPRVSWTETWSRIMWQGTLAVTNTSFSFFFSYCVFESVEQQDMSSTREINMLSLFYFAQRVTCEDTKRKVILRHTHDQCLTNWPVVCAWEDLLSLVSTCANGGWKTPSKRDRYQAKWLQNNLDNHIVCFYMCHWHRGQSESAGIGHGWLVLFTTHRQGDNWPGLNLETFTW